VYCRQTTQFRRQSGTPPAVAIVEHVTLHRC